MKIQILGTSAYERIPATFCNCPICKKARKLQGKNVRTQAQAIIDDNILVDYGQDNFIHAISANLDFTKLKLILLTHAHFDHLNASDFVMTAGDYGHNDMEKIIVIGNQECYNKFKEYESKSKCEYMVVEPFKTYKIKGYEITALPASHGTENPYCYIISDKKTTVLYNCDSALFDTKVYQFIKKKGFKFDIVVADCTYGLMEIFDFPGHMSLLDNIEHKKRLFELGAIDQKTVYTITHYSHNGLNKNGVGYSQKQMENIALKHGMISAYDNIVIEK